MFKRTVSQHRSLSLPGSNTGIQHKSFENVIKCRLIAFTLPFLKCFKVVCTAGCNLPALNGHAQWRRPQTADASVAADHRPLRWIHFRLGKTGSPGRRHSIKGQQRASPVDYRALIWHEQMTDLEPRWWMSDWACVMERGARECETERERERRGDGVWVSERELLFPPNPSYWISAVGIHHSLPLCYLGIDCKTLIKAHLPTTHTNTACVEHLCDSKMRNFRSINFVVDSYITIWRATAFKRLQLHHILDS